MKKETSISRANVQPQWYLSGEYCEACSCDYVCPCLYTNLEALPSHTSCVALGGYHIDAGRFDDIVLDDLNFATVVRSPGAMIQGGWVVGLIVDERANPDQRQALSAIASGRNGGPFAPLAHLVSDFRGVEARPIHFIKNSAHSRTLTIPGALEHLVEGVVSPVVPNEPLMMDNTLHFANKRIGLARVVRMVVNAFGINWQDTSGQANGHYTAIHWRSDSDTPLSPRS